MTTLIEFLDATKHKKRHRTRIIKQHPELINELNNLYPEHVGMLSDQIRFFEGGYPSKCKICRSPLKNVGAITCSYKCRVENDKITGVNRTKLREDAMLKKYGVVNAAHLKTTKDKRSETMLKKYGGLVSPLTREKTRERASEMCKKGRKSVKEKYNVDNVSQLKTVRNKISKSLKKYYSSAEYLTSLQESQFNRWAAYSTDIKITSLSEINDTAFVNPNQRISFVCNVCNNEETLPSETFKWRFKNTGTPCIKCSNLNKGSQIEKELSCFLSSVCAIESNNRTILDGKEIDVFLPEHNIGIELNGLYWHNDLRRHKNHLIEKTTLAKTKNVKLIHIFEDEWKYKRDIVENRLKHILGYKQTRIHGRSCQIKEINTRDAREFIEKNHLQGYAASSIKLGAFYNNELIAVMSFSKLSVAKGISHIDDHWELSRFCLKNQYTVPGIAGKLFSNFIRNYNPEYVLSYSDLRWQTNTTYEKIGFKFTGNTRPGYWYISGDRRIHRFRLRKSKTEQSSHKTEEMLRREEGYLRIWDCGHSKWEWTKKPA